MRILGIDFGTTSIKAVELDSAFGRYEIRDYYEHPIEPGTEPSLALSRLLQALPKAPDRIAMAMPTRRLTFRNLQLPTRDRKTIQTTVGFELEDELPFPIEKAVYDYSVLSQAKAGTMVHVAATLKKHLQDTLETWQNAGVDPDVVTSESWAYRSFLNRVLSTPDQQKPVILVDVGHSRTVLYTHMNGFPVMIREIAWGGQDCTIALAQHYQLNQEQAETAKRDNGFVADEPQRGALTPEQAEVSDTLMGAVRELIVEIRQAMFACKSATHQNVAKIFIAGGASQLPGLARVIEESLRVPVRPVQALSSIATSGITYSEHTDAVFLLAAAAAVSQIGNDRNLIISFRKGAFSKQGRSRELNMAALRRPLRAAALVAASLFVSLIVESQIYRSRLKDVDMQLERSLKGFFPSISASATRNYLINTDSLRSAMNKELSKQRELAKLSNPNPRSPLDALKKLSTTLPKDTVVDLTQFQIGAAPGSSYTPSGGPDPAISMTFLVANPQMIERLQSQLSTKVSNLQKGKVEDVPPGPGAPNARLKVTFTGKPTEDLYAN